jgi:hypothetical protein
MNNTSQEYIVSNIIKSSLAFDKELYKKDVCKLEKKNELLKSELQNLMLSQQLDNSNHDSGHDSNNDFIKLSNDLFKINNYIIDNINFKSKEKNTLAIFFYKDNASLEEWRKKSLNKYNKIIEVNCNDSTNPKIMELCSAYKITSFPSVKYVSK